MSKQLGVHLATFLIYENTRPDWLLGNELDFYLPEIDIAIEIQGNQHYIFVPYFHGTYDKFIDQLHRDRAKKYLCEKKGIKLYEICTEIEADVLIVELKNKIENKKESIFDYYFTDPLPGNGHLKSQSVDRMAINTVKQIRKIEINKNNNFKKSLKMFARLIRWCNRENRTIQDKFLLDFYNKNKNEIDERVIQQNESMEREQKRKKERRSNLMGDET